MKFRPKDENQLAKLSDDDLVSYLIAARDAGLEEEVRTATWMLIDRRYGQVVGLVRARVRDHYDAEEIVQQVIEGALFAKFRGEHTGEFFSMLFRIARNKIADYFERKTREQEMIRRGPEDSEMPAAAGRTEGFEAAVDLEQAIEQVLSDLPEHHQMVIRLRMMGYPSREVAGIVSESGVEDGSGMTPANCDQIYSRFRKRLREILDPEGEDE